jgi:hypothetical protein
MESKLSSIETPAGAISGIDRKDGRDPAYGDLF